MGLKTMMRDEEDYTEDGGSDDEAEEEEKNGTGDEEGEEADELGRVGCSALVLGAPETMRVRKPTVSHGWVERERERERERGGQWGEKGAGDVEGVERDSCGEAFLAAGSN
ncbi:hypothetical protein PS1_036357 [Malus domestica]